MTRIGVILGTASYMSPEQARGLVVDRSADIWAWGCVLFEMLAGRRAFDGADTTDVIAAVVRGEPDWSRLPARDARKRSSSAASLPREGSHAGASRTSATRDSRWKISRRSRTRLRARRCHHTRERFVWAAALLAVHRRQHGVVLARQHSCSAPREMRVEITTPPTTDLVSIRPLAGR